MKSNSLNISEDGNKKHSHLGFHINNLLDFSFGEENTENINEDIDMNKSENKYYIPDNKNERNINHKENIKFYASKTLFNLFKKNVNIIESPEKTQFLIINKNIEPPEKTQFLIKKRNVESPENIQFLIKKRKRKIIEENKKSNNEKNAQKDLRLDVGNKFQKYNEEKNSLNIQEDLIDFNNDSEKIQLNSESICKTNNQRDGFDYILNKIKKIDLHNREYI